MKCLNVIRVGTGLLEKISSENIIRGLEVYASIEMEIKMMC